MGRGVAGAPPNPSLAPGDGAGPGRAGLGRCPPPEPPRRRWDPVGPVQRLGGGGWGPSPALALGPFPQHGVVGTGWGGVPVLSPPPRPCFSVIGDGGHVQGARQGCWVDRASVSPCPSLLWCSGIPGGGGTVSAPSSPPAPVQPGGCPVCVGPTVFGVCPGRMLLLALLVAGLAGKHQGPCPSWGELGAGGPRRGLVWPPPPHMRLAPPPARPRQMCCSCLVPGPIRLGPPGGADAPPPRGSAGRPAGAVGVGTGICWRWGCRRAAGAGSGPVGCCVLCLRCGEMGSAVICAWCWGLPHSPWAWVQGGPVAPPLA